MGKECEAHNYASRTECFECGEPKSVLSNSTKNRNWRQGDWECKDCGAHNFASREQCFDCGIEKSGAPRQRREEGIGKREIGNATVVELITLLQERNALSVQA